MAVENLKDKRYLERVGDKVILHIEYEDAYDQSNINNMIKAHIKSKESNQKYLDEYEKTKSTLHDIVKTQIDNVIIENKKFLIDLENTEFREKIKNELLNNEIETRKKSIDNFENIVEETYKLALNTLNKGQEDSEEKVISANALLTFWKDYYDLDTINEILRKEEKEVQERINKQKE